MTDHHTPDEEIVFTSGIEVELIRSLAGDPYVVQAARVSTGRDLVDYTQGDGKLINYLMREHHGSPFEHGMFTFRVSGPIYMVREWQRHRAGWSYNEVSGRYTELAPVFYLPPADRKIMQQGKPGQYRYADGLPEHRVILDSWTKAGCVKAWRAYEAMLSVGISRELARGVLPLTLFTSMYATCNPRSLMHWLSLRSTSERAAHPSCPQWEIAEAARQAEEHFSLAMPVTWSAFDNNGRVAP